jgi:hypothetical protein
MAPHPKPLKERVEKFIMPEPMSGCWLWTGSIHQFGYGMISMLRTDGTRGSSGRRPYRSALAHRVVYELYRGKIADGLVLDHLCRNPACVNPDHLEQVTQLVNIRRGDFKTNHFNRLKTHCTHGHEFTPENTYIDGVRSWRNCRTCWRERDRAKCQAA